MPDSNPDPEACDSYQVLDSSSSLSIPSEPPDIKNWFSSYAHESPTPHAHGFHTPFLSGLGDDKKGSDVHENDDEERGNSGEAAKDVVAEKRGNGSSTDDEQETQSFAVGDSSCSLSLPSEPADLGIWFSSYAYESPVLDTSDNFAAPIESECEKENLTVKECKEDEVVFGDKISSIGFVKCNRSLKYNQKENNLPHEVSNRVEACKDSPTQNNSCSEKLSGQGLKRRTMQSHDYKTAKNPGVLSLNSETDPLEEEEDFDIKNDRMDPVEERSNQTADTELGVVPSRSNRANNEKGDEGHGAVENGFVSTRKSRSGGGDRIRLVERRGTKQEALRNAAVSLRVEKDGVVRREPLSETTNFRDVNEAEITGKWRCPQKSKPNLGPPLKQLRLEQWLRRV